MKINGLTIVYRIVSDKTLSIDSVISSSVYYSACYGLHEQVSLMPQRQGLKLSRKLMPATRFYDGSMKRLSESTVVKIVNDINKID